jgi:bacterioferritin-associated ferredoxin
MKRIVCLCEDVTDTEVADAVKLGHAEMESVKRYTGAATGPCQGKQCLVACQRLLRELTGKAPEEVGSIVHRPPLSPLPLGLLAGEVEE